MACQHNGLRSNTLQYSCQSPLKSNDLRACMNAKLFPGCKTQLSIPLKTEPGAELNKGIDKGQQTLLDQIVGIIDYFIMKCWM